MLKTNQKINKNITNKINVNKKNSSTGQTILDFIYLLFLHKHLYQHIVKYANCV